MADVGDDENRAAVFARQAKGLRQILRPSDLVEAPLLRRRAGRRDRIKHGGGKAMPILSLSP